VLQLPEDWSFCQRLQRKVRIFKHIYKLDITEEDPEADQVAEGPEEATEIEVATTTEGDPEADQAAGTQETDLTQETEAGTLPTEEEDPDQEAPDPQETDLTPETERDQSAALRREEETSQTEGRTAEASQGPGTETGMEMATELRERL
jgi:hypothetical protein